MKKFNDIFTITDGIFNVFKLNFATAFAALFPTITETELNIFAGLRHGNKYVIDGLNSETKSTIVSAVIAAYLTQWQATAAAINGDYNFNNTITRTKVGEVVRETDGTDTQTNFEKVFNDIEQTDTDKNVNVKNGVQTDVYDLTETETKQMQIDNVEKIIRLRRQNLYIEIIDTICNNITLNVY